VYRRPSELLFVMLLSLFVLAFAATRSLLKQDQLSQRDRATLRVIEYLAKSPICKKDDRRKPENYRPISFINGIYFYHLKFIYLLFFIIFLSHFFTRGSQPTFSIHPSHAPTLSQTEQTTSLRLLR